MARPQQIGKFFINALKNANKNFIINSELESVLKKSNINNIHKNLKKYADKKNGKLDSSEKRLLSFSNYFSENYGILNKNGYSLAKVQDLYKSGNLNKEVKNVLQQHKDYIKKRLNSVGVSYDDYLSLSKEEQKKLLNQTFIQNNDKPVLYKANERAEYNRIKNAEKYYYDDEEAALGYMLRGQENTLSRSSAIKNAEIRKIKKAEKAKELSDLEDINFEVAQGNFLHTQEKGLIRSSLKKRSYLKKAEEARKLEYLETVKIESALGNIIKAQEKGLVDSSNRLKASIAKNENKEQAQEGFLNKFKNILFGKNKKNVEPVETDLERTKREFNEIVKKSNKENTRKDDFWSNIFGGKGWYGNAEDYHAKTLRKKEDLVAKGLYSQENLDKYRNAGITTMDYIMGNKVPQTAAGVLGTFWIVNALAANRGQQTNAQLYGQDRSYMPY